MSVNSVIHQLGERERKVASLIACGCSDREIATAISVSVWSVQRTVRTLYEVSAATGARALVVWCQAVCAEK